MSNKRVVARQLKQKKKQRQQLAVIIGAVIVLAIAGAFGLYGYDIYSKSYIMTYEGEKIKMADFRFSMMASSGAEDVKDTALTQLVETLTLEKRAKDEGLSLTEEEHTQMLNSVETFKSVYASYGMDFSYIADERIAEMMAADTWYNQLMEKYTADYTVDEVDYAAQLKDYKENSKASYYDIDVKYIGTETREELESAVAQLATGQPFDEVLAEYSIYYSEETEIQAYALKDMSLPEDVTKEILELAVGGHTEIAEMTDGTFAIFYVEAYTIPDEEVVDEEYRTSYTSQHKNEIFGEVLNGWVTDADYELNQKAYDAATA